MGDMKESRFTSRLSEKSLILSDIPIGFLANADVTGRAPRLLLITFSPMHDMAILQKKLGTFFGAESCSTSI